MEDKLKVIFIEDDPNLGLIIVLALQSKGYEVYYANTLSGIQDMIEKDYPNILLLDLEVGQSKRIGLFAFYSFKASFIACTDSLFPQRRGGNNTLL